LSDLLIPDNLLAEMAKQCHLSKKQFFELLDCPMDQEKYEKVLRQKGLLSGYQRKAE